MNLIDENGKRLEKIREDTKYNLNYEKYTALIDKREQESKRYDRISKDTLGLVIAVPEDDKDVILADTSRKARSDAWILGLKKDVYLSEAFHIIKDMNNYNVADVRKEEE